MAVHISQKLARNLPFFDKWTNYTLAHNGPEVLPGGFDGEMKNEGADPALMDPIR
jgi:hypothetical protein